MELKFSARVLPFENTRWQVGQVADMSWVWWNNLEWFFNQVILILKISLFLHVLHPRVIIVPPTVPPVENPAADVTGGKALVPTVLGIITIVSTILRTVAGWMSTTAASQRQESFYNRSRPILCLKKRSKWNALLGRVPKTPAPFAEERKKQIPKKKFLEPSLRIIEIPGGCYQHRERLWILSISIYCLLNLQTPND